MNDGVSLIPRVDLFCNKRSGVPTRFAVQALQESNLEWLVEQGYSTGKLKEWIKEQLAERGGDASPNDLLPEKMKEVFNVYERQTVVVRGAGS